MPELDGIAWQQQREVEIDAGLDWLEDLAEETRRLVEEDAERYGHLPWPRPAVEDEGRVLELYGPDVDDEAA